MVKKNSKFTVEQCYIVPAETTDINHRSECNPKYGDDYPIFCSPMSSVTDENNFSKWKYFGLIPILPRTVKYDIRKDFFNKGEWTAFGLNEFEEFIAYNDWDIQKGKEYHLCIDIANGHMKHIYDVVDTAKDKARIYDCRLVVMVGNIANPKTYKWICENSDVDYVRLCIGTGDVCTTTPNTGIHYPSGSLISECAKIRNDFKDIEDEYHHFPKCLPKIVCDGGLHTYSDINKALALGADYVMLGSVLASLEESTAYMHNENDYTDVVDYYGMSTEKAQILMNAAKKCPIEKFYPKVEEGTYKKLKVSGSCSEWITGFDAYLRSAMAYANCRTLEEFTSGYVQMVKAK